MPTVKIGLIGAGTVGSGVYRIIKVNNKLIEKRTGTRKEKTGQDRQKIIYH